MDHVQEKYTKLFLETLFGNTKPNKTGKKPPKLRAHQRESRGIKLYHRVGYYRTIDMNEQMC